MYLAIGYGKFSINILRNISIIVETTTEGDCGILRQPGES